MPFIAQVAVGRRDKLLVFGDDYPTPDGTCLRDYIHVEDLAAGHLAALDRLGKIDDPVSTWNLGTGHGHERPRGAARLRAGGRTRAAPRGRRPPGG